MYFLLKNVIKNLHENIWKRKKEMKVQKQLQEQKIDVWEIKSKTLIQNWYFSTFRNFSFISHNLWYKFHINLKSLSIFCFKSLLLIVKLLFNFQIVFHSMIYLKNNSKTLEIFNVYFFLILWSISCSIIFFYIS